MRNKRTTGFWILIVIGIFLTLWYLIGQTTAIFNYDFTVSLELQEPVEEITQVGVALNKGFGLGDTLIYIPLLIIGLTGLLKRKIIGIYAMFGALAITVYWPIVALSTLFYARGAEGFTFDKHLSYSIILSLIVIYGLWGMWYLFTHKESIVEKRK